MIPSKWRLLPSKKLLDPNQAAQRLRAHKVKLTWKDLYIDYRNYRRAYYFIPIEKWIPEPKVEVDPSKFSLIRYFKELFEEKNLTPMRQMYINVIQMTIFFLIYLFVQYWRGRYYGWYLGDPRSLSKDIAQQQPIMDDIYKKGKQKGWS